MKLPNFPNPLPAMGEAAKLYTVVNDGLKKLEDGISAMKSEMTAIRIEHLTLTTRTATLEEARKSQDAQIAELNALKDEVAALRAENSDLKTRMAVLEKGQQMVDMQIELAITKTMAKLEVEFARQQAVGAPPLPRPKEAN